MADFEPFRYAFDTYFTRSGISSREILSALEMLPMVGVDGPWLAGGALRRAVLGQPVKPSDLDLFFRDEAQYKGTVNAFKEGGWVVERRGRNSDRLSKDGWTVNTVKLVFYASLEDVLDAFDFTICQWGTDGHDLVVGPYTQVDTLRKRLAIHKVTYGASTVRRAVKYAGQGFTLCAGTSATLLEAVVADPTSINAEVDYVD